MNYTIKSFLLLSIIIFIAGCGFKPIYKLSEGSAELQNYLVEVQNSPSREIIDQVNRSFLKKEDTNYKVYLNISENLVPLIINTNGTVSKYRVEIVVKYQLEQLDIQETLLQDTSRGFAQYDVGLSEIDNEETKKQTNRTATNNALQLMMAKIQSHISKSNED